ncbi:SEC-C metal-binding domain-containing protein, partial [Bilophila wadsworthia]
MKKKIGRNDLCWCGSGKKYKKCHLYRINEKIINKNELFSMYKKMPP